MQGFMPQFRQGPQVSGIGSIDVNSFRPQMQAHIGVNINNFNHIQLGGAQPSFPPQ